jgi:hypothetical protein
MLKIAWDSTWDDSAAESSQTGMRISAEFNFMFCERLPRRLRNHFRSLRRVPQWQSVLQRDAEFQILLSEFRYPPIRVARAKDPGPDPSTIARSMVRYGSDSKRRATAAL